MFKLLLCEIEAFTFTAVAEVPRVRKKGGFSLACAQWLQDEIGLVAKMGPRMMSGRISVGLLATWQHSAVPSPLNPKDPQLVRGLRF